MGFSFSFRDIFRVYYEKQLAQLAERQMYFCRYGFESHAVSFLFTK